jgi:tetratricopeptide (TPR) repeat protein
MTTVERQPPARRTRPVFWLLTFLLVIAGVEAGSRIIEAVENAAARGKNPFIEAINPVPAFHVVELGGRKMVQRSGFHPLMNQGQPPFPLERPAGGLRVFLLGGSAAAGWPYHTGETNITALLRRKLERLYPGRPIEVVNMAAGTYASHRVKLILEEVIHYAPDVILLYNGNNEFLENLVYRPRRPPAPWDVSAVARLGYRVHASLTTPLPRIDVHNYDVNDQSSNNLSFAFSQASRYREDPRQFEALLAHYRFNMESMVSTAAAAGVPLLLATCPVNLKDWSPNVSRHRPGLTPEEQARWIVPFREGTLAWERGDPGAAIGPLRAAVALDGEYAEAHFLLGEALLATGRRDEARAEYQLALLDDAFPFRELPEFQAVLREVAARRGVPLVDLVPPLEAASGDGLLGLEVFTDYVHLNERGQEIAAQALLEGLLARGLLPGRTAADVAAARIEVQHEFSAERDTYAIDVTYGMAMLMHQYGRLDAIYQELVGTFTRAARERPDLAEDYRNRLGLFQKVHHIASAYRDLARAAKLGLVRQLYAPADAERIHRMYTEMIYQSKASNLSREEFERRRPPSPVAP